MNFQLFIKFLIFIKLLNINAYAQVAENINSFGDFDKDFPTIQTDTNKLNSQSIVQPKKEIVEDSKIPDPSVVNNNANIVPKPINAAPSQVMTPSSAQVQVQAPVPAPILTTAPVLTLKDNINIPNVSAPSTPTINATPVVAAQKPIVNVIQSTVQPIVPVIIKNEEELSISDNDQPLAKILNDEFKLKDNNNSFKTRKIYDYRNTNPSKVFQKSLQNQTNMHIPTTFYQLDYTKLLFSAVYQNNIGAIKTLLERGANINSKIEPENITPLMLAIKLEYNDIINFLILRGADLNILSHDNKTALHYAAMSENIDLFNYLIQNGGNTSIKDLEERLPIYYLPDDLKYKLTLSHLNTQKDKDDALLEFTQTGSTSILKKILSSGANINAKDQQGNTPLLIAVKNNDLNTTNFLLNSGADIEMKNLLNENVFSIVQGSDDPTISQIIDTHSIKKELEEGKPNNIRAKSKSSLPPPYKDSNFSKEQSHSKMDTNNLENSKYNTSEESSEFTAEPEKFETLKYENSIKDNDDSFVLTSENDDTVDIIPQTLK